MGTYHYIVNHTKKQYIEPNDVSYENSWNSIKFPGIFCNCSSWLLTYLLYNEWVGDRVKVEPDHSWHPCDHEYVDITKEVCQALNKIGIPIHYDD